MESKVILFLGSHGRGIYNAGDIENAESAIIRIEERTKKIPNEDKILVIECGGRRPDPGELFTLSKEEVEKSCDEVKTYYKNSIIAFKEGRDVIRHGWATTLLKFGVDNGYYSTELEEPNFDLVWEFGINCRFDKYEDLQINRDEVFVNQLIGLMKEHPNKILIVVRGKQHEKWMPDILKRNDIPYEIVSYPERAGFVDRWSYKLSKSFNRKIK